MSDYRSILAQVAQAPSALLSDEAVLALAATSDTAALMEVAAQLRDIGHQNAVSY